MRLVVSRDGTVSLLEPEDLRRFKLVTEDPTLSAAALQAALGSLGRVEGDAVWVDPAALRGMGALAGDPAWQQGVTDMIGFAAKHGWVDAAGAIRVHVERGGG